VIGSAELDAAIDDVIAVSQEHRETGIAAKLAAVGLEMEDVQRVVARRWADYAESDPTAEQAFTQGYTEALMVAFPLARRQA
jgi:hypothetical protein